MIIGRQSWGVHMKLGKNGNNRGKTTLKTGYKLRRIQYVVCQVDFNAATELSNRETTVKSNGPMTFYRHCNILRIKKNACDKMPHQRFLLRLKAHDIGNDMINRIENGLLIEDKEW